MDQETKTYRLSILSPVHVGCDQVYEPTSFVVREQTQELISFHPFAFLQSLTKEERQEFSTICKQGSIESILDIYKFINRYGQHTQGHAVAVGSEFLTHYKQTLEMNRSRVQRELQNFLINRTAFNPVSGNVYMPGSSVKGSLRTAVLNFRHQKRSVTKGSVKGRWANQELEKKILDGGKFSTDPFSRVKVSDFRPVGNCPRKIVYGIARKKKPNNREVSAPYQIFEVVEPGAKFEGSITIAKPEPSAGIKNPITFEEIEAAIGQFFGAELEREVREASSIGVKHEVAQEPDCLTMRVGRHSGAECVTIDGHRDIKIMGGKGGNTRYLPHATTTWFTSDTKKPRSSTELKPFGWVALSVASDVELRETRAFEVTERQNMEQKWLAGREERERIKEEVARKQEQDCLALEKQQAEEEEARLSPWRAWIKGIEGIVDWGMFRQLVLDNKEAEGWRNEPEVGSAVAEVAHKVKERWPEKWDVDRDRMTAEWLEGAKIDWGVITTDDKSTAVVQASPQLERIAGYRDWGHYKTDPIALSELDKHAAERLTEKFKAWRCHEKKAKKDKKKAWKELQAYLRKLRH